MPFKKQIRQSICGVLGIKEEQVSIKAKTSEKMGFCGREEGIEAFAVVSLSG